MTVVEVAFYLDFNLDEASLPYEALREAAGVMERLYVSGTARRLYMGCLAVPSGWQLQVIDAARCGQSVVVQRHSFFFRLSQAFSTCYTCPPGVLPTPSLVFCGLLAELHAQEDISPSRQQLPRSRRGHGESST